MKIPRWRSLCQDTVFKRRLMLSFYSALLLAVGVAVLAIVISLLAPSPDRLAEIGDWLAAGTFVLAAVAGLVALQAYASATGPPRLEFQMQVRSWRNRWIFDVELSRDGACYETQPHQTGTVHF